ncbi:MAG TPA: exodeoxyribonuclease VII small subunit [Steroidobacteraceae bacterium]|nr:exodeoxyribonuclease VII small subunit [Steroidobacteraceae bacterium]
MPQSKVESKVPEFEQALAELETLVERLERGDLPLDEALKTFERGVELTRHCQGALKAAQQRVEILLRRNGQPEPEPYALPESQPESQELATPPPRR